MDISPFVQDDNGVTALMLAAKDTSNKVGKELNLIVRTNLQGSAFHCPQYIKYLSYERHIAFKNIKKLSKKNSNIDEYLSQYSKYVEICKTIQKIKRAMRSLRYKAHISSICNHFIEGNSSGWNCLEKLKKTIFFGQ